MRLEESRNGDAAIVSLLGVKSRLLGRKTRAHASHSRPAPPRNKCRVAPVGSYSLSHVQSKVDSGLSRGLRIKSTSPKASVYYSGPFTKRHNAKGGISLTSEEERHLYKSLQSRSRSPAQRRAIPRPSTSDGTFRSRRTRNISNMEARSNRSRQSGKKAVRGNNSKKSVKRGKPSSAKSSSTRSKLARLEQKEGSARIIQRWWTKSILKKIAARSQAVPEQDDERVTFFGAAPTREDKDGSGENLDSARAEARSTSTEYDKASDLALLRPRSAPIWSRTIKKQAEIDTKQTSVTENSETSKTMTKTRLRWRDFEQKDLCLTASFLKAESVSTLRAQLDSGRNDVEISSNDQQSPGDPSKKENRSVPQKGILKSSQNSQPRSMISVQDRAQAPRAVSEDPDEIDGDFHPNSIVGQQTILNAGNPGWRSLEEIQLRWMAAYAPRTQRTCLGSTFESLDFNSSPFSPTYFF